MGNMAHKMIVKVCVNMPWPDVPNEVFWVFSSYPPWDYGLAE